MTVGDLSPADLRDRLRQGTLLLPMGPLLVRIEADDQGYADTLHALYAPAPVPAPGTMVADVVAQLRRVDRRTSLWVIDGRPTGRTFHPSLAFTHFEWVMHIALSFGLAPALSVHAAVAARDDGRAVALVGRSGSGKSTLCAGLVTAGWRLVADEFLVVNPDGGIVPVPGVITLKGRSIEIIRARLGDCRLGPVAHDTDRGPIAHLATPKMERDGRRVHLSAVVFPYFRAEEEPMLVPIPRGETILRLAEQSHNYHLTGPDGFRILGEVSRAPAHAMRFDDLDAGIATVTTLVAPE